LRFSREGLFFTVQWGGYRVFYHDFSADVPNWALRRAPSTPLTSLISIPNDAPPLLVFFPNTAVSFLCSVLPLAPTVAVGVLLSEYDFLPRPSTFLYFLFLTPCPLLLASSHVFRYKRIFFPQPKHGFSLSSGIPATRLF